MDVDKHKGTEWEMKLSLDYSMPHASYNVLVTLMQDEAQITAEDSQTEWLLRKLEIGTEIDIGGNPFTVIGKTIDENGCSLNVKKVAKDG